MTENVFFIARQANLAVSCDIRCKYVNDICMNLDLIAIKYDCLQCAGSMTIAKVNRESHLCMSR